MTKQLSSLLALFALVLAAAPAAAQYDDVYFTPSEQSYDYERTTTQRSDRGYDDAGSNDSYYGDEAYADADAGDTNDSYYDGPEAASDYEYASRIRRFQRPVGAFDYYDPYYVDAGYYDPYFRRNGFNTTLIYNTPTVAYQRVRTPYGTRLVAVNTFSSLGYGNPYGFNRFNAWNDPFYGPSAFNRGGFNSFGGFNRFGAFGGSAFGGGGFGGGGLYCPPSYYGGTSYVTGNNPQRVTRQTTSQPRGNTTSIADRINRQPTRSGASRGATYGGADKSASSRSGQTRRATPTRSGTSRTGASRSGTQRSSRSARPSSSRSTSPRSTVPSSRSNTPSRSTSPSRSTRSRSYTPSRSTPRPSTRSYTPSRSSSPSRSVPSRSGSSSRSSSSRSRGGK